MQVIHFSDPGIKSLVLPTWISKALISPEKMAESFLLIPIRDHSKISSHEKNLRSS
jgi:hypothetical protein